VREREGRGLPLRAFIPNAVTVLALCAGLTGIRYAFAQDWEKAMIAIVVAGVLDGMDGNIARMLKANSKFGAELDSLCDNIGFGTAPALILFQFSLSAAPKFGWTVALALAVSCALRLARFNARIDADVQPHKSAGFNTGVPAPVGAGLAFAPVYLWLITGNDLFRDWQLVMPWTLFVAILMISAIPTYSWTSIRIRRSWRVVALAGVALLAAALINEPFITLLAVSLGYLLSVPFSLASYARVKRRRAAEAGPTPAG
jgi:CDP-diacylglycerol--serine O-phosphatidyltransferase